MPASLSALERVNWPSLVILPPNAQKALKWLGLDEEVKALAYSVDRHDFVNEYCRPFRIMGPGFFTDLSGLSIQVNAGDSFEKIIKQAVENSNFNSLNINNLEDEIIETETRPSKVESRLNKTGNQHTGYWLFEGKIQYKLPLTIATSITDVWTQHGRLRICPLNEEEVFWQARLPHPGGLPEPHQPLEWLKSHFKHAAGDIASILNAINIVQNSESERMKWVNMPYHNTWIPAGNAITQLTGESLQAKAIYLEEAFQLPHYLAKNSDCITALQQFEERCRQKTRSIYQDEWWTSQLHRHTAGRRFLRLPIQLLPEKALKKQLNMLYGVNGLDAF